MAVGRSTMPARQSETRCLMNLEILTVLIVLNGSLAATSLTSASIGEEGIDVSTFLKTVQPQVVNLLETNRGVKFNVFLNCVMERVDMKTGQVTRTDAPVNGLGH